VGWKRGMRMTGKKGRHRRKKIKGTPGNSNARHRKAYWGTAEVSSHLDNPWHVKTNFEKPREEGEEGSDGEIQTK